MIFPTSIKIGAINYTIEQVDKIDERDSLGETTFTTQKIKVKKGTPDHMWVTLFHEMFHGVNGVLGEFEVELLANSLYQILKENPKLLSIFMKERK